MPDNETWSTCWKADVRSTRPHSSLGSNSRPGSWPMESTCLLASEPAPDTLGSLCQEEPRHRHLTKVTGWNRIGRLSAMDTLLPVAEPSGLGVEKYVVKEPGCVTSAAWITGSPALQATARVT